MDPIEEYELKEAEKIVYALKARLPCYPRMKEVWLDRAHREVVFEVSNGKMLLLSLDKFLRLYSLDM